MKVNNSVIPDEDRGHQYFEAIDYLSEFIVRRSTKQAALETLIKNVEKNLRRYIGYRTN